MPTIEPTTVMPLSTVSKIGSFISFSAGSATKTSVPPRRSEPNACSNERGRDRQRDRLVGAAEALDRRDGILLRRVHRELGTELACELELLVVDVDGDDPSAGDARVLDRQVAEAADAEHRDEVGRAGARDLDRLVGRHAGAGERSRVERVDAVGHPHDVAARRRTAYSAKPPSIE